MTKVDGIDVVSVDPMEDDEELVKAPTKLMLAKLSKHQEVFLPSAVDVASEGSEIELLEADGKSLALVDETVLRVSVHDVLLDKYVVEVKKTVETDGNPVPVPAKAVEDEFPGYGGLTVDSGGM